MKRIVSVVLAAGAAIVLSAASAQAQVSLGVGGGLSIPLGDFGDAAKTGWNLLANVGYNTPTGLGVRGDFFYGQHNFKGGIDAKWKLAGGLANVLYSFQGAGAVTPYVIGTVGVMNLKADGGGGASASESKLTFGGGGGIVWPVATRTSSPGPVPDHQHTRQQRQLHPDQRRRGWLQISHSFHELEVTFRSAFYFSGLSPAVRRSTSPGKLHPRSDRTHQGSHHREQPRVPWLCGGVHFAQPNTAPSPPPPIALVTGRGQRVTHQPVRNPPLRARE
jgi:hypothetical protein